ncbi:modification methylase [candidate division WOR-3 bacterium]|nr:modification methylase [candidate division WOR-3 bacterium]
MKNKLVQVEEIPSDVDFNSVFEITTNNVSYFTHGFFKYPCKFIPQIPRWAILKYTNEKDYVLDTFAGSGTTLVEAVLHKRYGLGVDFDKLSQLLCKTKTTGLSQKQIAYIDNFNKNVFKKGTISPSAFKPDLHNIHHWFSRNNIIQLSHLKEKIHKVYLRIKDKKVYNFLLVCFAATIRKCSYADDNSPKPYVSSRFIKKPLMAREAFTKVCSSYLKRIDSFKTKKLGRAMIIAEDARNINAPKYAGKVALAVTSPPYINAFDYVRSLRLENAWLDYYGDSNILKFKRRQVGTEIIPSEIYCHKTKPTGHRKLDSLLHQIYKKDRKRAHIVKKFFEDMDSTLIEVHKLLKNKSHYVMVIGANRIRGINIPTHEILIDYAINRGFKLHNLFSYIIKNRYLRIPRSGRGGIIKRDWVIDFIKING